MIRVADGAAALVLLVGLSIAAAMLTGREQISGAVRVVDGDTLVLAGRRVRLVGLDAPELDQTCGSAPALVRCGATARAALQAAIGDRPVACRVSGHDKYGRALATCSVEGRDLGADLVRRGFAVSYGGYRAEERAARDAGLGVWAGAFVPPAEWRRTHLAEGRGE